MKCLREKGQGPRIDQYFLRSQSSQSNEIQRQEANHSSQDISTPVIDVRRTCMDTVSDEPNDPCEPGAGGRSHLCSMHIPLYEYPDIPCGHSGLMQSNNRASLAAAYCKIQSNGSFYNIEEAVFTLKLIQSLIASGIEGSMIGVITLYKSQMDKLSNLLHSDAYCDHSEVKHVQVSTVDAFQGAEKEIIVLSCVRTKQVGFIDSEKRMNVALTRGKRHL
ncbi:UNVERIFIED_CONTAM: hypothetical protein FKN15_017201 [Acipenser sinensis]